MKKILTVFFICSVSLLNAQPGSPCVNKTVYAFQAFSDGCTNKYQSINWSLLTHFAFCSVAFDANGNITPNGGCNDPSPALVNLAHSKGVKVVILIWSPGNTAIVDGVLASASKRQTLANSIKNYIQQFNLDGVNIDFENIPATNSVDSQPNKSKVVTFSQVLHTTLKAANPAYHIAWSTPYTKECQFIRPVWDFTQMTPYVDAFTVMSYDYIAGNTGWTGSHQPFAGGPQYGSAYGLSANKKQFNFQNTVTEYLAAGVPASKIVMGQGFYGIEWKNLSSGTPAVNGASGGTRLNYNVIAANAASKGKQWFNTEKTHYYSYQNGGWVQGFFDSDSTLGVKLDHINSQNLGGLMIWALHYDSGRVELWNKVQQKFCSATDMEENESGSLLTVFPNPMQEFVTINSDLTNCSVTILDVTGNRVKDIPRVDRFPLTLGRENMARGIYLVEFRAGDLIERKKLVVE